MGSIVRVFSPLGIPIAWLNVKTTRAYITNNYETEDFGTCQFEISTKDSKCTNDVLQFGNILFIEDENEQLPDWVGFIDTYSPRVWKYGVVEVNAVAAEKLLDWRIIYNIKLTGTTANMWRQMVYQVNNFVPNGIQVKPGYVYQGEQASNLLAMGTATDIAKQIAKFGGGIGGVVNKTRCDYSITGRINDRGTLDLYANLYEGQRGVDTGLELTEHNTRGMEDELIEQGEIWNFVFVYSTSDTVQGRIIKTAKDNKSIAEHGLRVAIQEGVGQEPSGLQWQADRFIRLNKDPQKQLPVTLLNVNSLYASVDLGNKFTRKNVGIAGFSHGGIGLEEKVRITDFEVDDESGEVGASLEII